MLELHPLCTLFPRMGGAEFAALVDDIAANGLQQPIVVHGGMILDGGNRYRACLEALVKPSFVEFDGDNVVSFVLSANLHRRHMSPGQQAAIVASAQDWAKAQTHGGDRKTDQGATLHLDSAAGRAAASGASLRTQKMADKVAKADPELARKVAHKEISLPKAVEEVAGKPARYQGKPKTGPKADAMRAALKKAMGQDEQAAEPEPSEEAIDPLAGAKPNKKIADLAKDLAGRLNEGHFPVGEEHEALVRLHAVLGALLGDEVEMQLDALTRECERLTQENQRLQAVAETDLGQKVIEAQTNLLAMRQRRDSLMQEIAGVKQENEQLKKARRAGHGS